MGDSKRPRDVFRDHLLRLMADSTDKRTAEMLAAKSGVSRSAIDRYTRSESEAGIDNVGAIAKAFGLEVWQMLLPSAEAIEGSRSLLEMAGKLTSSDPPTKGAEIVAIPDAGNKPARQVTSLPWVEKRKKNPPVSESKPKRRGK